MTVLTLLTQWGHFLLSTTNTDTGAAAAAGCSNFTSVRLCTDSVFSAHNQTQTVWCDTAEGKVEAL